MEIKNIHLNYLKKMFGLFDIITVNSFINIFTNLIMIGFVSLNTNDAPYLLGLYFPLQFLLYSLTDAIRVSICRIFTINEKEIAFEVLFSILFIYTIAFLMLIPYWYQSYFVSYFHVVDRYENSLSKFFSLFLIGDFFRALSESIIFILMVINKNNKKLIYRLIIGCSLSKMALTYLFCKKSELGVHSYTLGTLIPSVTFGCVMIRLLLKADCVLYFPPLYFKKLLREILETISPIMIKNLIIFLSLIFINHIISRFGEEVLTGFNLVTRIRQFYVIPAIAFGTSVATFIINQNENYEIKHILRISTIICIGFYLLFAGILYLFQNQIIQFFSNNEEIIYNARLYLLSCIASIVAYAYYVMSLCILDVLGLAVKSAIISGLMSAALVAMSIFCVSVFNKIQSYYFVLIVFYNLIAILILIYTSAKNFGLKDKRLYVY